MPSFNLLTEAFIPCRDRQGQITILSLTSLFEQAPDLVSINGNSPIETAAVYRLLLAILTRVLQLPSPESWDAVRARAALPLKSLKVYLNRFAERFDLFHPKQPFYQTAGLEQFAAPIQKLFPELASGNNDTLFDHTYKSSGLMLDPARTALGLLALQSFAVGGLVSFEKKEHRSAQAAPLASALMVLVRGKTVFETLILNCTRYNREAEQPFASRNGDRPAWERDEPVTPSDRIPEGLCDLLTFQSRRALLRYRDAGHGKIVVDGISILKGFQLDPGWGHRYGEPYVAFRHNADHKRPLDEWVPVRLNAGRAVWRDSAALFCPIRNRQEKRETITRRPYHLEWLALLRSSGLLPPGMMQLMAFGQATDQASILLWREEHLLLPVIFLTDDDATGLLRATLALAENCAGSLGDAVKLALEQLAVNTHKQAPHLEGVRLTYWSALEEPFHNFLWSVANAGSGTGLVEAEPSIAASWADAIVRNTQHAFTGFASALSTSAHALAAVAYAERSLGKQLRAHCRRYQPEL